MELWQKQNNLLLNCENELNELRNVDIYNYYREMINYFEEMFKTYFSELKSFIPDLAADVKCCISHCVGKDIYQKHRIKGFC